MTAVLERDSMAFRFDPQKVKELREERGWTIDDLVHHSRLAKAKLSRQTIVDVENGTSKGSANTLGKLKKTFGPGVSADLLLAEYPDEEGAEPVAPKRPRRSRRPTRRTS